MEQGMPGSQAGDREGKHRQALKGTFPSGAREGLVKPGHQIPGWIGAESKQRGLHTTAYRGHGESAAAGSKQRGPVQPSFGDKQPPGQH